MRIATLLLAGVVAISCSTAGQQPATTAAKAPVARGYFNLLGLGSEAGVLLYAGETAPPRYGGRVLGDVWLWRSGQGWKERKGIGEKDGFAFYDVSARRMVGLVFDTGAFEPLLENWTYDPSGDSWTERELDQRPEFPNGAAGAFDAESRRFIVFGGETWAYDPAGNTWTRMNPKRHPTFGAWYSLVYAEREDRLVLLGGEDRGDLSDVWTYDFNHDAWTEITASAGPPARMYSAVGYDPRSDRLILFGGLGDAGPLNDTWSYDLTKNAWTELKPSTPPPARTRHAMAYDSESGKFVMFGGGEDARHFLHDTWLFDPGRNEWSRD